MNKNLKRLSMAACAMCLLASVSINSAMAYFTTYAEAAGTKEIRLEYSNSTMKEKVKDMTKHLVVENIGEYDIWVRAKAFCAGDIELVYDVVGTKWVDGGDGYFYYTEIVKAGGTTEGELKIKIQSKDSTKDIDPKDFNVVVIQECCPVMYASDGRPATSCVNEEYVVGSQTYPDASYWASSKVSTNKDYPKPKN